MIRFLVLLALLAPSASAQTLEMALPFMGLLRPAPSPPLEGFDLIRQQGKLVRVPQAQLPVRLYSNDPGYAALVRHAVGQWNGAGAGELFRVVSSAGEADFTIDWTGRGLPSDCAGRCALRPVSGGVQVSGLAMDPRNPQGRGNMAQVLIHELGHALGLGHSENTQDAMFEFTHPERTRVEQARLTARDRQAVSWLYRQKSGFLPIGSRVLSART